MDHDKQVEGVATDPSPPVSPYAESIATTGEEEKLSKVTVCLMRLADCSPRWLIAIPKFPGRLLVEWAEHCAGTAWRTQPPEP